MKIISLKIKQNRNSIEIEIDMRAIESKLVGHINWQMSISNLTCVWRMLEVTWCCLFLVVFHLCHFSFILSGLLSHNTSFPCRISTSLPNRSSKRLDFKNICSFLVIVLFFSWFQWIWKLILSMNVNTCEYQFLWN